MDKKKIIISDLCYSDEPELVKEMAHVFNAIYYTCRKGGYVEGWRNSIAVDFSIACYVLDLEPWDYIAPLIDTGLIHHDDEDTEYRFDRVEGYLNTWYPIENYMCNREHWSTVNVPEDEIVLEVID